MMGYGFGWFGPLGMGIGLIVWLAVIALAVWAASALFGHRTVRPEDTPLEILKRRYARGEISKAEFEQARQDLA